MGKFGLHYVTELVWLKKTREWTFYDIDQQDDKNVLVPCDEQRHRFVTHAAKGSNNLEEWRVECSKQTLKEDKVKNEKLKKAIKRQKPENESLNRNSNSSPKRVRFDVKDPVPEEKDDLPPPCSFWD